MEDSVQSLRGLASHWSLAGDKELLNALQTLHQKIMEKCQETNRKLDEMVTVLDETSLQLQNVNNKFTSLSNSQFIESRVYDDDGDIASDVLPEKEQKKEPTQDSEMAALKRSLQVLEEFHERVTILCDSDSDTSDDEDNIARVVLKPKDMYSDRPLPYIIGSQAWKSKWHAGLLPEDSDVDSDGTKPDNEHYSDSEPERSESPSQDLHTIPSGRNRTISSASSELQSEQDIPSLSTAGPKPTQSDIAAELARRLGGGKLPDQVKEEISPPQPTVRKLYKPEKPVPAHIFTDEPPPLEFDQSETSDDDIFAEINKTQPYSRSSRDQGSIADDLFGQSDPVGTSSKQPAKPKSPLFDEDSEPDLFADKPKPVETHEKKQGNDAVKKPAGAMSLFGANVTAESIGAAILKRNQRKSSTSSDDSTQNDRSRPQRKQSVRKDVTQTEKPVKKYQTDETKDTKDVRKKERDIFDDLFARSEKINKGKEANKAKSKDDKVIEKKVDLFSDNLFDDIDDLFTTDVVTTVKDNKKDKLVFDDEDDLFSDVTVVKTNNNVTKTNDKKTVEVKSIFDSDEELFSEKQNANSTNNVKVDKVKESQRLFDDDLFSDVNNKTKDSKSGQKIDDPLFKDDDADLLTSKNQEIKPEILKNKPKLDIIESEAKGEPIKPLKELSSDEDDSLFRNKNLATKPDVNKNKPSLIISKNEERTEEKLNATKIVKSPDLFDEDDVDDLFLSIPKKSNVKTEETRALEASIAKVHKNIESNVNHDKITKTSTEIINRGVVENKLNADPNIASKSTTEGDIFKDDSSEGDLFSRTTVKSPKTVITTNLSNKNNSEIEEDIFKSADPLNEPVKPDTASKVVAKTTQIKQTIIASDSPNVAAANVTVTSVQQTVTDDKVGKDKAPNDVTPEKDLSENDNTDSGHSVQDIAKQKELDIKEKEPTKISTQNEVVTDDHDIFSDINANNELFSEIKANKDVSKIKDIKDVFSDIFDDQPPVFEKPKEPKRSKNVNALFDDDSDDEALFFRKVDTTLDDKPELFHSPTDDRQFGLFVNEPPPDVDLESTGKEIDSSRNSNDDLLTQNDDKKDKNEETPKTHDLFEQKVTVQMSQDRVDNSKKASQEINDFETLLKSEDDLFRPKMNVDAQKPVTTKSDIDGEPKKIGKLKPMNFNINVNTLLPGASPKKTNKDTEQTDGQAVSTKSNEELHTRDNVEDDMDDNKMVKSVSFEGKPDSVILDNKLSKERAKIQVKRRPSTRRARREAVKISGIDFSEDTTDNSSSIDDPPPKISSEPAKPNVGYDFETEKLDTKGLGDKFIKKPLRKEDVTIMDDEDVKIDDDDDFSDLFKPKDVAIAKQNEYVDIFGTNQAAKATDSESVDSKSNTVTVTDKTAENINISVTVDPNKNIVSQSPKPDTVKTSQNDVKSKVVYVLHDEDIFDSKNNNINIKLQDNDDDDDDIFKINIKHAVNTLGKVYSTEAQKDVKEPLGSNVKEQITSKIDVLDPFALDNDEEQITSKNYVSEAATSKTDVQEPTASKTDYKEPNTSNEKKPKSEDDLFKSKTKVKEQMTKAKEKKPSIFDSDDDTELFISKRNEKANSKNTLFASDNEEELFGKKRKDSSEKDKERGERKQSMDKEIKRVEVKTSLFGDYDDEDDLFGVKTKRIEPKTQPSKANTTKESHKSTEPVFQDPLTLLGSDEE